MRLAKLMMMSLLILGFFSFTACEDDTVDPVSNTIVDLAADTPELSSLVAALERAELTDALAASGDKTVFAPDNDAFQALLDSNPAWNTLEDIDKATLTNVLLFHVIEGNVKAGDLSNTYVNTLATGPNSEPLSLQINIDGGASFNGDATPKSTDNEVSNGVVHIINKVMLPPDVVTLASNNGDFSILVSALTREDLDFDYIALLNGDGPFTIFAPNNDAFVALLNSNAEWNELGDIPLATLKAVLNYHVIDAANVQADQLVNDDPVEALGGTLTIDLSDGAKLETTSGQSVNIALTDVQGTNGVIHVVEEVLIP
ncbi:MAG: fasciclin domain-containing protein [Bacteroidota bacterium]